MSIKVKLPAVFNVVDDDEMIETIKSGKFVIIAIPVDDIAGESKCPGEDLEWCPHCDGIDCPLSYYMRRKT